MAFRCRTIDVFSFYFGNYYIDVLVYILMDVNSILLIPLYVVHNNKRDLIFGRAITSDL